MYLIFKLVVVQIIKQKFLQHVFTLTLVLWTRLFCINVLLVVCKGVFLVVFFGDHNLIKIHIVHHSCECLTKGHQQFIRFLCPKFLIAIWHMHVKLLIIFIFLDTVESFCSMMYYNEMYIHSFFYHFANNLFHKKCNCFICSVAYTLELLTYNK